MKLVDRYPIGDRSDLIYAKVQTSIALGGHPLESLYTLAVVELGSNILKHGGSRGAIWLLEEEGAWYIVALDRGPGIADVALALSSGYTTSAEPSLGIGLSSLAKTEGFALEIVTRTDRALHGTVVAFGPTRKRSDLFYLSIPFEPSGNGDFFARKGQLLLFGDAAGHGRKAEVAARFVTEQFRATFRSVLLADEWLQKLHATLQERLLRPVELLVGAFDRTELTLVGVGNFGLWASGNGAYHAFPLRPGAVGKVLGKLSHVMLPRHHPIVLTTDGVVAEPLSLLLPQLTATNTVAWGCAVLFFCGSLLDDTSLLLIPGEVDDLGA